MYGRIWKHQLAAWVFGPLAMPLVKVALDQGLAPLVGKYLSVSWWAWMPRPICLRLFEHWMRAAASRTFCTAGTKSAIRMAMIAITTSSSISVNADRLALGDMGGLL